jgi:cytochrome c oxidase assembly protein subunit 15
MRFYYLSIVTLISIYLVVLAGGVVRMTGSGMGCPDWPKCFDQYIPPTSADQLPENYKDIYAYKRKEKIHRFGDFLTSLGFEDKAIELTNDESLLEEQDFSVFNTWTEYINRLTGVLAGLLILTQLVISILYFKKYRWSIAIGFILLLITLFQAWFGAMVVATNIVPWVLTIHMMLAIVMIIIQIIFMNSIYTKPKSINENSIILGRNYRRLILYLLVFGLLLTVLQTYWGTQVRQQIDELSKIIERTLFIENLDIIYIYHRTLAILFLVIGGLLMYINFRSKLNIKSLYGIGIVILMEAIIGKLFSVLNMAPFLQPAHLILSMILTGLFFYSFLNIINLSKPSSIPKNE